MKRKRKGLVVTGIDEKIHARIKLLAIARSVPMYKIVEEFMKIGLEHERKLLERRGNGSITIDQR